MNVQDRAEFLNAICRKDFGTFAHKAFEVAEAGVPFEHNWHIDCLPYSAKLYTPYGLKEIGWIVESGYAGEVLSYNEKEKSCEWKKVSNRMKTNGKPTYTLISSLGDEVECTSEHPIFSNGEYKKIEDIKQNDEILSVVQEGFLDGERSKEVLLKGLFCREENRSERDGLSGLRGGEVLHSEDLPAMHGEKIEEWSRPSMLLLWKKCLHECGKLFHDRKKNGSVLQSRLLFSLCDRKEQSSVYRWGKIGISLLQAWSSICQKKSHEAGEWIVSYLQNTISPSFGYAPCGQGYIQQYGMEYGYVVQEMSQQTERKERRGNFVTRKCHVEKITRNIRIPEATYNIEVEGNNNFFANGILTHNCVAEHLAACESGEIKRLIINVPPRTLKSYLVARAFPAWVLGRSPLEKFIVTSYGEQVVEQSAMACRRILRSDWYRSCFPNTLVGDLDRNTHWTTTAGGQYYAASALSPITGMGCKYMILDDPLKPMEASSEAIRKSTNENIRATLFNRFDDKRVGCMILVMQRVHEDDPTGNLLKDGGWTQIKLPAVADKKTMIHLGDKTWSMDKGQLLFPKRLTHEILEQTRKDMTEYHYVGQFLQEPAPIGGGEFRDEWPQYYAQGSIKPREMNVYILVDAASGKSEKSGKQTDRTAMIVVGCSPDNNYYLLDAIVDRMNPTDRINVLFMLHRKWNDLCGKPPKVGYEKYGMMTDTHYVDEKKKQEGYNFPLIELGGAMNKEDRIRRMIPDLQNGRWYFPPTLPYVDSEGRKLDLIRELIDSEMSSFPRARFDDMLDALSRIYDADLGVIFPRQRAGMVARARRDAYASKDDYSWESF